MGVCLTHMVTKWNWHCTHFPLATCQVRINSLRYQWKPVVFSLTLKSCLQSPLSILPILPSDNLAGKSCIQPWHQAMISHHISPGWIIKTYFQLWKSPCMRAKSLQFCLTLGDPMNSSLQAPLSMGFSRQEYWSGLQCPPPGHLPNPGIEPKSLLLHW